MILDAAEEKVAEVDLIVDRFGAANDVQENSTICTEISQKLGQYSFLKSEGETLPLPFIFGIRRDTMTIGELADLPLLWEPGVPQELTLC